MQLSMAALNKVQTAYDNLMIKHAWEVLKSWYKVTWHSKRRKVGWQGATKFSWPINDGNGHYLRSKKVWRIAFIDLIELQLLFSSLSLFSLPSHTLLLNLTLPLYSPPLTILLFALPATSLHWPLPPFPEDKPFAINDNTLYLLENFYFLSWFLKQQCRLIIFITNTCCRFLILLFNNTKKFVAVVLKFWELVGLARSINSFWHFHCQHCQPLRVARRNTRTLYVVVSGIHNYMYIHGEEILSHHNSLTISH